MSDQPPPAVPPAPRYGEYAPGYQPGATPPPPPAASYSYGPPPTAPAAGPRRRKTWDIVLTIVLLALGLFGLALGLMYAAIFSAPDLLDEALRSQGYGGFDGEVGAAPAIIAVSHVVLYLVAVGLSIPLMLRGVVAFWIPLAAGLIAAVIFWTTLTGVFLSDPGLMSQFT